MIFEWDDAKSRRNLLERGFGFDRAATIFIGSAGTDVLSVVYSDRGELRRIISARLANRKERKLWQSFIEQWNKSDE